MNILQLDIKDPQEEEDFVWVTDLYLQHNEESHQPVDSFSILGDQEKHA